MWAAARATFHVRASSLHVRAPSLHVRAPVPVLTVGHIEPAHKAVGLINTPAPSQTINNSVAWSDLQRVAGDTYRGKGDAYMGVHTWL